MKTIQAVKCDICDAMFDASGKGFIHLQGGIHVGMVGGILGGAPVEGKVHDSIYCPACFYKVLGEHFTYPRITRSNGDEDIDRLTFR